jgi:hypothetical protein
MMFVSRRNGVNQRWNFFRKRDSDSRRNFFSQARGRHENYVRSDLPRLFFSAV